MKRNKIAIEVLIFSLMLLSLAIKHLSPYLIQNLYANNEIFLLNLFSGNLGKVAESVDFYLGRSQEVLFGPVSLIFSGSALILFCLKYLERLTFWKFAATLFIFLIITKFEILFFPPYGDSASGPVIEGIWLLHNDFNYAKLAGEVVFVRGGPKVYLFSLYPTYLAILMKIFTNGKMFVAVNHVLIFGASAIILSYFRSLAYKIFNKRLSVLLTIFLLSLPLVQSQIEQINMEIPVLFFAMACLYYVANKKILRGALFAGLAIFTKLYSVYMGGVVLFVGLYLFFFAEKQKGNLKVLGSSILSVFFAIAGALSLFFFMNLDGSKVDKVGMFQGFYLIKTFPVTYFYTFSFIALIVFAILFIRKQNKSVLRSLNEFILSHFEVMVIFVCSMGWFVLFLNSGWIPPRYTLLLLPSLILGAFYVANNLIQNKKLLEQGVMALIFIGFLCSYGLPYEPVKIQDHAITERSLEYRNDVLLHMKLAKLLEEKYSNLIIGAPFTLAQVLAFPEMGFTSKKLDIMIYLYPCTYGGVRNFEGFEKINPKNIVWVGVKTPFMFSEHVPYGLHDLIIEELEVGNKYANLFVGGFSVNALYHYGQSLVRQMEAHGIKKPELKAY